MPLVTARASAVLLLLLSATVLYAQESPSTPNSVPRVVPVSGVFIPVNGQPAGRVETVTVAIYADQEGGTPVWQETQSVVVDERGRYSLVLGATRRDGIPVAVFASGAQWLGILFEREGEVERARVRLTSVPYALRASDADTLGGHPASDYLLATTATTAEVRTATRATSQDSSLTTTQNVQPGVPNYLAKYVSGTDVGISGVYDAGGSVGIGTTTPLDALHVRFTNTFGGATGVAVQNLGNTATSYSGMLFYDQNGSLGQFQGFNNSTHEYRINNIAKNGGNFDGSINFMIGSTSGLFVGSTGNIGIGTTNPSGAFEVSRDARDAFLYSTTFEPFGGNAPGFISRFARGTRVSPAAVAVGDLLGLFGGAGYGGTQFSLVQAGMAVIAAESWTATTRGTALLFGTTAVGAQDPSVANMSILPNGNVGVGTPRLPVTGVPTATDKLQVVGDIRVGTSGTNGCIKDFSGAGIVGTCSSDRRLKRDITPFGPVLSRLTALQPVHYFWRAREFPDRHFGSSEATGLIAQDVEQVLPELVETDSDGYKAVNYSKLPLLTIQAMKELQAENEGLKARISELERLMKQLLPNQSAR